MAYTRRLLSGFPALVEKNSGFPATANAQKIAIFIYWVLRLL
jgi:hypothetical protein